MVKDTNSAYFDSAYFVLKSDLPRSAGNSDMLAEAHRMIEASSAGDRIGHSKKSKFPVVITLLCTATTLLIVVGLFLLLV